VENEGMDKKEKMRKKRVKINGWKRDI